MALYPTSYNPDTVEALDATERDERNPRQLRSNGLIPATVYGKGMEPKSIQIDGKHFTISYSRGARLFKLGSLGLTAKAHQVQIHSYKRYVQNVEFLVS